MARYEITWVERDRETGAPTRTAAMLGLDERTEESDWTLEETIDAAEHHGQCAGIDLGRYAVVVEQIED